MKKISIKVKDTEMEMSYDQKLIGAKLSVIHSPRQTIASINYKNHLFTLESNGGRREYWLECVMYVSSEYGYVEESFSDPVYEMPKSTEEAKDVIVDWFEDELGELIKC